MILALVLLGRAQVIQVAADLLTIDDPAATRPRKAGDAETCSIPAPQKGTCYVMVLGFAAFSGVALKARFTPPLVVLVDGVPAKAIASPVGVDRFYRINTPVNAKLTVRIAGGTGNADLYTRFGAKPTATTYLCRPFKAGNTETCTVAKTLAGSYYIMLRARTAYSGVTLNGAY